MWQTAGSVAADSLFTAISICTGAGLLDHGLNAAIGGTLRPILYVERDAAAAANLAYQMEQGYLPAAAVWSDLKSVAGAEVRAYVRAATGGRSVDFLLGGIPCQPWSQNGVGRGSGDVRDLWPASLAAIKAYQPGVVFFENVDQIVNHRAGAPRIQRDLEQLGFRVAVGLFQSDETGGAHRRRRCYILAVADAASFGKMPGAADDRGAAPAAARSESIHRPRQHSEHHNRSLAARLRRSAPGRNDYGAWREVAKLAPARMPALERELCGMADGLAGWYHRLRLIGNGVDPLVAGYAFVSLWACLQSATE